MPDEHCSAATPLGALDRDTAAALLTVLYAPSSYLHPARRRGLPAIAGLPPALAHAYLRRIYRLQGRMASDTRLDALCERCIREWRNLPRVAALIGARLMHGTLLTGSLHRTLDARLLAFLRLPLPTVSAALSAAARRGFTAESAWLTGTVSPEQAHDSLASVGLTSIAPLFATWPAALRERLPLLFSSTVATRGGLPGAGDDDLASQARPLATTMPRPTISATVCSADALTEPAYNDASPSVPGVSETTIRNWLAFAFIHARLP
ncbi:hypothetical protein [Chitinasiproducens palmae]|uniref:Type III secretion apparatus protein (OrgA_MxiK) n=1 Tax=Chitinasiproducens palmae TaxID=1770053 RepID=A0A1H2PJ10_9BURK|nr:hypothetical protein [Chitinasiproducens palmae]SDV46260.1 type III secretion apparatus protein (OrgA_MxiK) [Chitinasiproducens palmae]